ncbi:MAG: glycosyl hydrolase, partial [Halanaerobiales bacterium]
VETGSEMGVYPEGSEKAFSAEDRVKTLPTFSKFNKKKYYLEVYNKKADPFEYEITNNYSWIELSEFSGVVRKQERIWVSINWEQAPIGEDIKAGIKISGTGEHYKLEINVFNPANPEIKELEPYTFVESNGYISIEAEHYVSKEGVNGVGWEKIDDYGRTLSSMFIVPSTADSFEKPEEAPYLEYRFYAFTTGDLEAVIYTAPGLNVDRRRGLKYAISIDRKELQMVDTFPPEYDGTHSCPYWAESVMNNAHITSSTQHIEEPGYHTLRIMMVDPGVVIQKIVLDMGGVKPSYLGPPESFYKKS